MLVVAADVGSVIQGNFAWSSTDRHGQVLDDTSPDALAQHVSEALAAGELVALGFECPLAVPVPKLSRDLGRQRDGEAGRPWSVFAGAGALALGLAELAWVLGFMPGVGATVIPSRWSEPLPLFLWEAFVSGVHKPAATAESAHINDARAAVRGFQGLGSPLPASGRITTGKHRSLNLAATAALSGGLRIDPSELSAPILVVDGT